MALAELLQAGPLGGKGAHQRREARLGGVRLPLDALARGVDGGQFLSGGAQFSGGGLAGGLLAAEFLFGVGDFLLEDLPPRGEGFRLGGQGGTLLVVEALALLHHGHLSAQGLRLVAQGGQPVGEVGDDGLLLFSAGLDLAHALGVPGGPAVLHLEEGGLGAQRLLGGRQGVLRRCH